jgi:hypothetical protein
MKNTVYDRLLRRETATDRKRYSSVPGIYGDRKWVQDLDIVNELEGHSGCVNALRWVALLSQSQEASKTGLFAGLTSIITCQGTFG